MAWITMIRIADSRTIKNDDVNHKCEREMTLSFPMGELKADDKATVSKWTREVGELVKAEIDLCLKGITPEVKGKDTESKPSSEWKKEPATSAQVDLIKRLTKEKKLDQSAILKDQGISNLNELTKGDANEIITLLKEKK